MSHTLRFCRLSEVGLLQEYIAKHWREDHIFVRSREVLDFQYLDRKNSRYNVLVAYNEKTREFDGILGFTLLSQYDENLRDAWIWTSIWSAKRAYASLGLKLYRHLFELLGVRDTSTAGLSGDSVKFCQLFYDKVGRLDHFYIKNEAKKRFKLAKFAPIHPPNPKFPTHSPSFPRLKFSPAAVQIPRSAPTFLRAPLSKFFPPATPPCKFHPPHPPFLTPPNLAPQIPSLQATVQIHPALNADPTHLAPKSPHKFHPLTLKKLSLKAFKNSPLKSHFFPQKSKDYYIKRYLKHPFYKYEALGVFCGETLRAVFFARTVRVGSQNVDGGQNADGQSTRQGASRGPGALLLVDFAGHTRGDVRPAICALLQKRRLEFASLLCHVPQRAYFLEMGFSLAGDDELLPVYYEPFLRQNSPIFFALKGHKNAAFFKGDSDQDRPNLPVL